MRAITSLRDLEDTYAAQTIALAGMGGEEDFDPEEEDYWTSLLEWVDAQG